MLAFPIAILALMVVASASAGPIEMIEISPDDAGPHFDQIEDIDVQRHLAKRSPFTQFGQATPPVERTNGVISQNFQHNYQLTGNDHFFPVNRGSLLLHPHAYHLIDTDDERRGSVKRSPLVNINSDAPDQDDGSVVEDGLEIVEVVEERHLEKRSPKPPFDPISKKKKFGKKGGIFGKKGIFGKAVGKKTVKKGIVGKKAIFGKSVIGKKTVGKKTIFGKAVGKKTVKKGKFGTKTVVKKGKPIAKKGGKKAVKAVAFEQAAPLLPAVPAIPALGLGGLGGGALAFGVPGTGFEGFFG